MTPARSSWLLWALLGAIGVFVWHSSAGLPPVVASHFAASGAANGTMPREVYRVLLLVLSVGAPAIVALVPLAALRDGRRINVPHAEYWLADERRGATLEALRRQGQWFAALVAGFLAYVHWLVVQANLVQPPRLSTPALQAGLLVFFLALAAWIASLWARFRRPT